VSLAGEVRPVAHSALRLREAAKLGFSIAYGPTDAGKNAGSIDYRQVGQLAKLVDRVMASE
jgi:DNA repair protein RadA/Sms